MAYNLIAETQRVKDWEAVHRDCMLLSPVVEFFPIPADNAALHESIGISIPSKQIPALKWRNLVALLKRLRDIHGFRIHDLYSGEDITDTDFSIVEKALFS